MPTHKDYMKIESWPQRYYFRNFNGSHRLNEFGKKGRTVT